MILNCSHLVITSENVPNILKFFKDFLEITPHFENKEFGEFILPSKFRFAFFKPTGKSSLYFALQKERKQISIGLTVKNIEATYQKLLTLQEKYSIELSGPPKEHPWGEKSFLLIDPEQNRWEITESPTPEGHLVNK
jgi:uncharacterized glyoxalase superfamily protein PhnB